MILREKEGRLSLVPASLVAFVVVHAPRAPVVPLNSRYKPHERSITLVILHLPPGRASTIQAIFREGRALSTRILPSFSYNRENLRNIATT